MLGYRFGKYTPPPGKSKSDFEKLLKIFMQLVLITSGNVAEALQWLTELDKQYGLSNEKYGIGDFIDQLKREGYITDEGPKGEIKLKAKSEQRLRQSALEEIFGKLKKTKNGEHNTVHSGRGDEQTTDRREYEFGDTLEQISVTDSLKNAQINPMSLKLATGRNLSVAELALFDKERTRIDALRARGTTAPSLVAAATANQVSADLRGGLE